MKQIDSFKKDHTQIMPGISLSNTLGTIYTYDLRFKKPNGGNYLNNSAMHTIEHMFATVIRNSDYSDRVVYFGPMGCRTGFYLLLINIKEARAKELIINTLYQCLSLREIPGTSTVECGNAKEHDLGLAQAEIQNFLAAIC